MSKIQQNIVEGIGWDVTIFLLPAFILLTFGSYYLYQYLKPTLSNWWRRGQGEEIDCAICLQPLNLQTSGTCGHPFCSNCIFTVYERLRARIPCPACRKPITTMFKLFQYSDPPTQQQKRMHKKIKDYNYLYDDNRGILRCIFQLPYLWGHIRNNLTNIQFYSYVLRNSWKYRMILILIIYILSPLDILPQSIMGIFGLIDDFFVFLIIAALIAQASLSFARRG